MISSMRNFFITFIIALVVFGVLAYVFYPKLVAMLPTAEQSEEEETSEDVPGEVSGQGTTSGTIEISDPVGRVRGSVGGLLIYQNDEGEAVGVRYVRFNLDSGKVAYCEIPVTTTLYNDVGASVPIADMFGMVSGEQASEMILALTGFDADFFLTLTPDSLSDMIAGMNAPYFNLKTEIDYKNPKYADYDPSAGTALPTDYYRHVDAGRVGLNKETLDIILEYYREIEGGGQKMDAMLLTMYSMLMNQIVNEQCAVLSADYARTIGLFKRAKTNLSVEFLGEYGEDLFGFAEAERKVIPYSGRTTIKDFKDFDR